MTDDDHIDGALQENILVLLVFDDASCKTVRASLSTYKLFENSVFREIAKHAIDYIDQYNEAPKEHIADSLEDILNGSDKRKATSFKRALESLFTAKDNINAKYVITQLHKFVRLQNLKGSLVKAVQAMEAGRIDDAEVELQRGLNTQVISFERGLSLADTRTSLSFLDTSDVALLTGIGPLDKHGIGLQKKEQLAIMAPAGKGKSWGLIHLGKWALLQRQTVVHITLEMSEPRVAQRYMQSFFALSKRQAHIQLPRMTTDDRGEMSDVFYEDVQHMTLQDANIRSKLSTMVMRQFRRRPPLIIKQFPTGMLTVPMLDAYLDGLERHEKIVPDVVLIDYPDLMAVDSNNLRTSIGQNNIALRGQAVRRNYAQGIASQSNREGAKAKLVEATHAAEDYSKIATADTVLTYTQTAQEKKLGLARILTAKARNEADSFITLLTQSYGTGQFAIDSAFMGQDDYWDFIAGNHNRPSDED